MQGRGREKGGGGVKGGLGDVGDMVVVRGSGGKGRFTRKLPARGGAWGDESAGGE